MNRLSNKKRKKSSESFPQATFPEISTDIIAGPVSHQARSNVGLEGEPYFNKGPYVDRPDLIWLWH